ncbi:MAG: aldehyde ferredoxin oxidoreductase family protein [Promethearchaeota archaeon]
MAAKAICGIYIDGLQDLAIGVLTMKGWTGQLLRVNLTTKETATEAYPKDLALQFVGGRGFAAKILWEEVPRGTDPLSPANKFIAAVGPLSGLPMPNVGKTVVASKSPLTGIYGDGNLGSHFGAQLRRSGYDLVVVEGKAEKPVYIFIEDADVSILDADKLWGKGAFEAEQKLEDLHGKNIGTLMIGQGGENLVKYAVVRSMMGRAGGRPGMGTVMGSKRLKALIAKGSKSPEIADPEAFRQLGRDGFKDIREKPGYNQWMTQGTMLIHAWCQEFSVLPSYNFKEGQFEHAEALNGDTMEAMKEKTHGCPSCTMQCGHCIKDAEGKSAELDYENVALLGSNIGMRDLREVATLNRLADEFGLDTISLGNTIGFAMEASERGLLKDKLDWGDYQAVKQLISDIAFRRGTFGSALAEGTRSFAQTLGKDALDYAMQIKGLEISGYDCHAAPGMALAFGVCSIGAHHKESWIITYEVDVGRESYDESKVEKVIELQRIRGGMFEQLVGCRFPWIEVGFDLEWYPKYFAAATGLKWSLDDFWTVADRVYSLVRSYGVRELNGEWDQTMDYPPARWFKEPLSCGPLTGSKLDKVGYEKMLSWYYQKRGWDNRGIPTKKRLKEQDLDWLIPGLEEVVCLT